MASKVWAREGSYEVLRETDFSLRVLTGAQDLDSPVDVEVAYRGSTWTGTVFTVESILSLMHQYTETGECLNGTYFWAKNPLIVREISLDAIADAVADLIATEELTAAFEAS